MHTTRAREVKGAFMGHFTYPVPNEDSFDGLPCVWHSLPVHNNRSRIVGERPHILRHPYWDWKGQEIICIYHTK